MVNDGEPQPSTHSPRPADFSDASFAARHAELIWRAGVEAVDSTRLVRESIHQTATSLHIRNSDFDLNSFDRVIVVGAGKASAGMARGLEQAFDSGFPQLHVEGWVNVPADCVFPLQRIHLHAARPAGLNEPTEDGVLGSQRILDLVSSMGDRDLCVVLLSGGGSALLPLPVPGISLADKQSVTRFLSRNGATIHDLNTVRKRLSLIKGGGLLRAAKAGRMITLIISDVIGDPLDVIASGPTVCDEGTAEQALAVLERITASANPPSSPLSPQPLALGAPSSVWTELRRQAVTGSHRPEPLIDYQNHIIGNNETALNAAIRKAESLGFEVHSLGSNRQGIARDLGKQLADQCLARRRSVATCPVCWIGGGEPVVHLASTERPRLGGRNQELALAALCRLWNEDLRGIAILSGGTDGEDGPTDAAGAVCCETVKEMAIQHGDDPFDALSINDSYTFFAATNGLLKTGPTHTNVMDLQVAVMCR